MTKRVIIGTHARKGSSTSQTYWKQGTPLDDSKMADIEMIRKAYLAAVPLAKCFYSSGFRRTLETVKVLTKTEPTPCFEISPYASFNDSEWASMDPKEDKLVSQLMAEYPDACRKIGKIGSDFIRNEIAKVFDGGILLFMTHRGVAEPIVATLLNQYPLVVPVTDFGQGDLTALDFDGDNIVAMKYMPASKAAAVVNKQQADIGWLNDQDDRASQARAKVANGPPYL